MKPHQGPLCLCLLNALQPVFGIHARRRIRRGAQPGRAAVAALPSHMTPFLHGLVGEQQFVGILEALLLSFPYMFEEPRRLVSVFPLDPG